MDKEDLALSRTKLEKIQKELEAQLKRLNAPVDMGDDIDSFDEETDEATEFSANMGMVSTLKRRHTRVLDALTKIDKGTYGLCEKCGQPIELEILKVDPESRLCKADKQKINR